jgi:WD40 repeat protein
VDVWCASSGELRRSLTGHPQPVWSVDFSPNGKRLVTASRDGTAQI